MPEILLGKAWPLVFGTVVNMPTIQMDEIPTGTIKTAIGIPDDTIERQLSNFNLRVGEMIAKASCLSNHAATLKLRYGVHGSPPNRQLYERGTAIQRQADALVKQAKQILTEDVQRFTTINDEQKLYDARVIPIMNGENFRQGVTVALDINGAHYVGKFDGENFLVESRRGPKDAYHRDPITQQQVENDWTFFIIGDTQEDSDRRFTDMIFNQDSYPNESGDFADLESDPCAPPNFYVWHSLPEQTVKNQVAKGFFFANAGSSVKIVGNYPIRYILSIVPGVSVINLSAKRTVGGLKVITPIPPWMYTVYTMTFGSITATIAEFATPLSSVGTVEGNQGGGSIWEDDVYATLVSPIGPNVVDIMIYLIQTYTEFGIDSTSFNYVRAKQEYYPANFALLTRPNIVELLKDIAFQSRCSIWLSNNKFYLKYLPEEAASIETINEDSVVDGTLEVVTTNTEDLVTKFIATWRNDYSKQEPNKVISKYNINKYGTYERTFDFFIYAHSSLVIKSVTFWLVRMANIWKRFICRLYPDKLKIETLDSITVDFNQNFLADVPFTGIVEKATFDSDSLTIGLEVWTPVRLGEMVPYQFAYPAGLSIDVLFPTEEDVQGGYVSSGVNADAEGDLGGGFRINVEEVGGGTYRSRPSDAYNASQPVPTVQYVTGYTPQSGLPPEGSNIPSTVDGENVYGTIPYFDYQYTEVNQQLVAAKSQGGNPLIYHTNEAHSRVYSGVIKAHIGDNQYEVTLYGNGLDKVNRTEDVQVVQLQIDSATTLTEGTWGLVLANIWYEENIPQIEYQFQIPVFVG